MKKGFRIPGAGRLKQASTARFSFDGQFYGGIEGDTLASALLANGVHLVGRSNITVRAAFFQPVPKSQCTGPDRARHSAENAERPRHGAGAL
jgi:hypothetical protein